MLVPGCGSKIIIPDSVTVIEDSAFSSNYNLVEVVMSKNVVSIGKHAFDLDTSLEKITLPASVKEIDSRLTGTCVVVAPAGSYAESFAKDNGNPVENN